MCESHCKSSRVFVCVALPRSVRDAQSDSREVVGVKCCLVLDGWARQGG